MVSFLKSQPELACKEKRGEEQMPWDDNIKGKIHEAVEQST